MSPTARKPGAVLHTTAQPLRCGPDDDHRGAGFARSSGEGRAALDRTHGLRYRLRAGTQPFRLPMAGSRTRLSSMPNLSRTALVGALAAALALGGCANNSGNTNTACEPLPSAPAVAPAQWKGGTVFTIVMENHSRGQILGNSSAPFINRLASENAVAEGYHDSFVHPSEPNYFWMVAGQNFGVLDDADPGSHHLGATSHIADQLEGAGLSWKAYQESMGDPCGLTSHGRYAAKHNPFAYFDDINGWDGKAFHPEQRCNSHIVDYSQLDADIAAHALASYVFITPNLDNDMHDGSIALGDSWLANEIPKLMATDN
ncbi:MAG: hypothetical protein E6J91_12190, partial [Deltaproteobacteria bacterium]